MSDSSAQSSTQTKTGMEAVRGFSVFTNYKLSINEESIIIENHRDEQQLGPSTVASPSLQLVFDRTHNHLSGLEKDFITLKESAAFTSSSPSVTLASFLIYGVIGLVTLNKGHVLIVITERENMGVWDGHVVYRLKNFKIIPVGKDNIYYSSAQKRDDAIYLDLLAQLLSMKFYFFSYTRDLTRSAQSSALFSYGPSVPLWERADDRFFWNSYMMEKFTSLAPTYPQMGQFILPIICGFFFTTQIQSRLVFNYTLISRRSRFRAGTRYHSRGIDESGNVANFVETEQLISSGGVQGGSSSGGEEVRSYVQVRGSIPFFWEQIVGVGYKPQLVIDRAPHASLVFKQHFKTLFHLYGPQIAVNLINKTGYEKPLGDEFARQIFLLNDPQLRYVHFDFHHECRKMQWHRVSILLDAIKEDLDNQGYCIIGAGSKLFARQTSTVRTNCIDCLDRTNVLQSILAQKSLERQFREMGVLTDAETLESLPEVYRIFKNVWADHADAISMQYSGTGALKTDFTRTGKRTNMGVLQDFTNSVRRYIKNHYQDGLRQDSFDLGLGVFRVEAQGSSPFNVFISRRLILVICFAIVTSFLVVFNYFISEHTSLTRLAMILICGMITMSLLKRYEKDFVSFPRLVRPRPKLVPNTPSSKSSSPDMSASLLREMKSA